MSVFRIVTAQNESESTRVITKKHNTVNVINLFKKLSKFHEYYVVKAVLVLF